jgi:hypothetical protein
MVGTLASAGRRGLQTTIDTVGQLVPTGVGGHHAQTYPLTIGSWLRRLVARNPLVRASDRVEAAVIFVALVAAVLVIPVVGAVGTATYDSRVHTYAAQRSAIHQVDAIAMRDTSVTRLPYESSFLTPLQWQLAGQTHSDTFSTPRHMKVGEHTSIFVDAAGDRADAPPTHTDAAIDAVMAALDLWAAVAGTGVAAWALLRLRLNRVRYATWDRELQILADSGGRRNRNT